MLDVVICGDRCGDRARCALKGKLMMKQVIVPFQTDNNRANSVPTGHCAKLTVVCKLCFVMCTLYSGKYCSGHSALSYGKHHSAVSFN